MIALDYRDKRPIYEQVADKLSQLIVCGALSSNTRMPSVRSLALELSVNPNTIQRAYAQLEQDGYLYTVVGRGNYVTHEQEWKASKQKSILDALKSLLHEAHLASLSKEEIVALLDEEYVQQETLSDDGHAGQGGKLHD
ncbi:MAG: GntR family transcriptional regulator [Clostridium sp.]|jgi:GntR family transcriptional regulator|nr:GntR family transcriptional regulator [Clostridium sp.]